MQIHVSILHVLSKSKGYVLVTLLKDTGGDGCAYDLCGYYVCIWHTVRYVRCVRTVCAVCAYGMYGVCVQCVRCARTVCTVGAHSVCSVCVPCVRAACAVCTYGGCVNSILTAKVDDKMPFTQPPNVYGTACAVRAYGVCSVRVRRVRFLTQQCTHDRGKPHTWPHTCTYIARVTAHMHVHRTQHRTHRTHNRTSTYRTLRSHVTINPIHIGFGFR